MLVRLGVGYLPKWVIGGSRTIDTAVGDMAISGNIGESGGSFRITKTGSAALLLSGANNYSGDTRVLAGALQVNNASAPSDSPHAPYSSRIIRVSQMPQEHYL